MHTPGPKPMTKHTAAKKLREIADDLSPGMISWHKQELIKLAEALENVRGPYITKTKGKRK
jgi:hypothetical protein